MQKSLGYTSAEKTGQVSPNLVLYSHMPDVIKNTETYPDTEQQASLWPDSGGALQPGSAVN